MTPHQVTHRVLIGAAIVGLLGGFTRPALADSAGYALKFDGVSDFVRLSMTSSMMASTWPTTKTVSLWVKPIGAAVACTASDPSSCDGVFGDRPRAWGISRGTLDGVDRLWVWNFDGTVDKIGVPYVVGEWVQIALVHSGGTLSAYKNGALVGSLASGSTLQGAGQTLQFGGIINSTAKNWTFEGEIDELQIWNVARTSAQIIDAYNQSLVGNEAGLAAYYKMSNGSGTTVTDDSGHGWTGTLTDGGSGVTADGPITWVTSGAFGTNGPPNTAPVANPQSGSTGEDTPFQLTLTGSDADNDPLTYRVVNFPAWGTLSGSLPNPIYTPAANFNGEDSFTFVVSDGHVDSSAATVSITVIPVNDDPVARPDSATTAVDTAVSVSVLGNDYDIDANPLVITDVSNPSHGSVNFGTSSILYSPAPSYTGTDAFTYTVSDGAGGQASAQVTITVNAAGQSAGWSLQFNGTTDFVKLQPTQYMMSLSWATTKTVNLWVKPTGTSYCSFPTPTSCDVIFGDRPRWWGISRGVAGGLDRIWVWNWDGNLDVIGIDYVPDQWVHISLVHGNGILSAYKNGVLVGSVPSGPTQQPPSGLPVLHLGGIINNGSSNWTFSGEIDEVQIWNTTRSTTEINQTMTSVLTGTEFGLSAYYRMSNGTGIVLTDDSGHGWTGSLQDGGGIVAPAGPALWLPSGAFGGTP